MKIRIEPPDGIKVWITKYALSYGIKECAQAEVSERDPTMVSVPWKNGLNGKALFFGNDWHISEAGAIARAEDMRIKKIASLKKQIAKLEKLKFVTSKKDARC